MNVSLAPRSVTSSPRRQLTLMGQTQDPDGSLCGNLYDTHIVRTHRGLSLIIISVQMNTNERRNTKTHSWIGDHNGYSSYRERAADCLVVQDFNRCLAHAGAARFALFPPSLVCSARPPSPPALGEADLLLWQNLC